MFYNVPARRRALTNAADEYARSLDLLQRYAIHFAPRLALSLRKSTSQAPDLSTTPTPDRVQTIRQIYGATLAASLLPLELARSDLGLTAHGQVSGPSYAAKKQGLLLFINDRLVHSPSLQRAIAATYSPLLPKAAHPWTYLALSLAPETVDPNVHPTKKEVHFLHEDEIVGAVAEAIALALANVNASRSFSFTQTILPSERSLTQSAQSTRPFLSSSAQNIH